MKLEGAAAVVTGGGSGIGAACVRTLAARGCRVVVYDRDGQAAMSVAAACGGRAVTGDILDVERTAEAFGLAGSLGPLRAVVCAAGIGWLGRTVGAPARPGGDRIAHDLAAFRRVVEVNTVGTFNTVRLAAAAMAGEAPDADGGRGAMVLVASAAAFEGQVGQAAYAASKAALIGLLLPVARDLAGDGIRVNALSPGVVDTPIYGVGESARAFQDAQVSTSVLFPARAGRAEEQASMVAELLANPYVNGTVVRVDAGMRLPPTVGAAWHGVGRSSGP